MSAHPQLAGACVVLVALVALVDGARGRRAAVGCGIGAAALTAAALYGQGLQTLRVPFGWPPGFTWRQIGFGTTRLVWWFRDGDLFDQGSQVPALTSLVLAAVLACTLLLRRRAPRALLLLGIGALGLSTCGPTLQALPKFGPLLLEFAQPLRVLALLAPISAALLAVVIEEAAVALRGAALPRRWHLPKLLPWTGVLVSSCLLAMAVPTRVRAAERLRVESAAIAAGGCRNVTGFDRAKLSEWFRSLQGGSLWFEQAEGQALAPCLGFHGLELESAVPIGNTSAVGSHLGVFWLAARQLQPERDGAARRARALGIRHVIRATSAGDSLPADFTRRRVSGQIELLEVSGAQRAHVGCVRERWSGSDRALRERLMRELATARGADQLLDPDRLIELTPAQGDLTVAHVDSECDATGATLHVVAHEPGLLEAVVESTRPVDVAFSATAFPAWRVSVNGAPDILARVIAPGYVYAHVPAGRHRIVAKAGSMPGYGAWLVLAALGVAALAWLDPCHLRAAWQYLRRARG